MDMSVADSTHMDMSVAGSTPLDYLSNSDNESPLESLLSQAETEAMILKAIEQFEQSGGQFAFEMSAQEEEIQKMLRDVEAKQEEAAANEQRLVDQRKAMEEVTNGLRDVKAMQEAAAKEERQRLVDQRKAMEEVMNGLRDVKAMQEAAADEERQRLVDRELWKREAQNTASTQLPVTYNRDNSAWVDSENNTVYPFCARSPWTLLVTCRSFVETPCTGFGQFCGVDIDALTARLAHLINAVKKQTAPTRFEEALHVWLFEIVRHVPDSLRRDFEELIIRAVTAYQRKNTITTASAAKELERVLSYPDACLLLVIMLGIVNQSHVLIHSVDVGDVRTLLFAKKPFANKCAELERMWRLNNVGRKKASWRRLGYGLAALLALGASQYSNPRPSVPAPSEYFF